MVVPRYQAVKNTGRLTTMVLVFMLLAFWRTASSISPRKFRGV